MSVVAAHGLSRTFRRSRGILRRAARVTAVTNVTVEVAAGETLGVVGEPGSGKSVLGRLLAGLDHPTSGTVRVEGAARFMSTDANPRRRVHAVIGDGLPRRSVREALERVGLDPALARRRLGDLSPGDGRRVLIARALAPAPGLVVLDEPVADLDVPVRAQVVNLLDDLRGELGTARVVLTRDLSVALHLADRVAVMYRGRVVEVADPAELRSRPLHPYTQALAAAAPVLDPAGRERVQRERVVLLPEAPGASTPGCPLAARCWRARELCAEEPPLEQGPGVTGHLVACHLPALPAAALPAAALPGP